jgi:hypothetical protein
MRKLTALVDADGILYAAASRARPYATESNLP